MELRKRNKGVWGHGVNDAEYNVYTYPNTKVLSRAEWVCPFYQVWKDMLKRVYDTKSHTRNPTYIGCSVCEAWHLFSEFREWMETQDWEGKRLDKDLLVPGNKLYSPETCCFLTPRLNVFLCDRSRDRGRLPVGVCKSHKEGRYYSQCSDPFGKRRGYLGVFDTPEEAHEAWRKRKHELACQYADMQTDPRVAEALRRRYASDTYKGGTR